MRRLQRCVDIGWLACDRQLTGEGEDGTAALPRRKRRAIGRHLLLAQRAHDAAGQHALNEGIRLQNHRLALALRPELAEGLARRVGLVKILPARHRSDELHEGEAAHEGRTARGEMKCERSAPILGNEISRGQAELFNQRIKVAGVINEAVGDVGLAGLAEADEVGRDAMRDRRHQRQDVAPDVRGGGIAVQEQRDRLIAPSCRAVSHRAPKHGRGAHFHVDWLAHVGSLNTV